MDAERIAGASLLVASTLLGGLPNLVLILTFGFRLLSGRDAEYGNISLLSLALANFFMTNFVTTVASVTSLTTPPIYHYRPAEEKSAISERLCRFTGWLHVTCYLAALLSLLFSAIHRYLTVHQPRTHNSTLTSPRCLVTWAFIWTVSACWAGFPFFGWGRYHVTPPRELPVCLLDYDKSFSYVLVTEVVVSALPVSLILLCVHKSTRHLRQSSESRADVWEVSQGGHGLSEEELSSWKDKQQRLLKMTAMTAALFAVCNAPLCASVPLSTLLPGSLIYWSVILGNAFFSLNWILCWVLNPDLSLTLQTVKQTLIRHLERLRKEPA